MTTKPILLTSIGILSLGVCGCGPSNKADNYKPKAVEKVAPVTIVAGKEAELFPIKAGNTWVYAGETSQSTSQGTRSSKTEVTFRVVDVTETPDGKEATIEVSSDGTLSDRMKWRVGTNGVYQVAGSVRVSKDAPLKEAKFEPAIPIVPFPVKNGSEVIVNSTGIRPGAGVGPFQAKVNVEGIQEVDTAMGRFSALSTLSESTYKEKGIQFKSATGAFWTPKIGIVRYLQEIVATNVDGKTISSSSVLRLKSHTP